MNLRRSELIKKVGAVSLGAAAAQLIMLAASPFLTRLYSADDLGVFGIISGIAFTLAGISTLKFDLSITVAKHNVEALYCAILSLLSILFMVGLQSAIVALINYDIIPYGGKTDYISTIPFQVAAISISYVATQWMTRTYSLRLIALTNVSRAVIISSIQLIVGFFNSNIVTLIMSQILGYVASIVIFYIFSGRWLRSRIAAAHLSKGRIIPLARKYIDLPRYGIAQEMLSSLAPTLTLVIIGYYFGPAAAGVYWLTNKVLQQPVNFLGQAVRQVFIRHLVVQIAGGYDVNRFVVKYSVAIFLSSILILMPLIVAGPFIFKNVFGSGWEDAGELCKWVSITVTALLSSMPAWCALHARKKYRTILNLEIITIASQIGSLAIASQFYSLNIAIAAYSISGAICYFLRFVIIFNKSSLKG